MKRVCSKPYCCRYRYPLSFKGEEAALLVRVPSLLNMLGAVETLSSCYARYSCSSSQVWCHEQSGPYCCCFVFRLLVAPRLVLLADVLRPQPGRFWLVLHALPAFFLHAPFPLLFERPRETWSALWTRTRALWWLFPNGSPVLRPVVFIYPGPLSSVLLRPLEALLVPVPVSLAEECLLAFSFLNSRSLGGGPANDFSLTCLFNGLR